MKPGDLVTLRFELDSMRHSITHALWSRHEELQHLLQAAFDRAIGDIENQVDAWVREEAERQAREMVKGAVSAALWDSREVLAEPIQAAIRAAVTKTRAQ
jgi:DNA-binding protein YbaB